MRSSSSSESGGQLLQELEALSQALYKAQIVLPGSNLAAPAPRREFDQVGARRRVSEAVGRSKSEVQPSPLEARHSISELIPKNRKSSIVEEEEQEQAAAAAAASREWSLSEEQDLSQRLLEHKKSGFWSWKPLRALAHIGQQRFHCEFTAHVHGIDKLPASMNGLRLKVQLRHKEANVQTIPARVSHGCAEFDEVLQFRCTVYGSKKSSGVIKFVSKSFTLAVVATDVEELDLGKHELDLSRILPSNYTPGAAAKDSSSSTAWNTSFKLSGKAKGAALWITFGYEILDKGSSSNRSFGNSRSSSGMLRSISSLPSSPQVQQPNALKHRKASSVVDFGSPAMSEPGNDLQDFPMEHFSLDDDHHEQPTKSAAAGSVSNSIGKGSAAQPAKKLSSSSSVGLLDLDRRGRSLFPEIDPVIAPETPGRNQEQGDRDDREEAAADAEEVEEVADGEDREDEGDDAEFNVVDQGTETSPLSGYSAMIQNENEAEDSNSIDEEQEQEQEAGSLDLEQDQDQDRAEEEVEENVSVTNVLADEEEEEDLDGEEAGQEQEEDEDEEEQDYLHEEPQPQKVELDRYDWDEPKVSNNLDELEDDDGDEDGLEAARDLLKSDDEAEIVTDEFLEMLDRPGDGKEQLEDEESQGDSPRALLLRQFEQEALLEGSLIGLEEVDSGEEQQNHDPPSGSSIDLPQRLPGLESDEWNSDEDKELAAIMDAAESELQKATQTMKSKARAKMLEDAEAEALLQEWGLDENVFHDEEQEQQAPTSSEESVPAKLSMVVRQQQQDLPALAPGLGPSVPTADGGSLRSMDPANFQGGKNDGKLVMHVSKPVVVPADVGSSAIDVLRNLAAAGTERMATQAMEAMPLEDITGKSVQQIALEGQACFEENSRRYDAALLASSNRLALEDGHGGAENLALLKRDSGLALSDRPQKQQTRSAGNEFLSLDELAPVAMEKIEELAMQGLKIQCDMAEEDAPYSIEAAQSSKLLIRGSSSQMNPNLNPASNSDQASSSSSSSDELISMSLSLDEWMRLDAGLDDEEEANEKTKAIMAAHRAAHTTTDLVLNLSGDSDPSKDGSASDPSFGKMGNTLTLAMLVQLRDPLRNYEPVGAPMMALVEAERVLVSAPRPKLWKRIGLKGNSESEYQEQDRDEDEAEEEVVKEPQFKITGVHMAGLNVSEDSSSSASSRDPKRKQQQQQQQNLWGSQRQQQSGSRWLIANGMGKSANAASKHPLLKSKPKGKQSDSIWSISSRSASDSGVSRNPDVKFGARPQLGGAKRRP